MTDSDPLWATRDGRELKLSEMYPGHVQNARKKLRDWLKGESDPEVKQDLRTWTRRFAKELARRRKEMSHARSRG